MTPNTSEDDAVTPVLMIPTLDGRPIHPGWRVSSTLWSNGLRKVDARKSFTLEMPTEPGVYHVAVMTVGNPDLAPYDRVTGELHPRHNAVNTFASSNTLRFEVLAPSP